MKDRRAGRAHLRPRPRSTPPRGPAWSPGPRSAGVISTCPGGTGSPCRV